MHVTQFVYVCLFLGILRLLRGCIFRLSEVNLESAGLNDSVAHLGYGGAFSNSSEAFMQVR